MPSATASWNYCAHDTQRGPDEWPRLFGAGRRQSPIDIWPDQSADVKQLASNKKLRLAYPRHLSAAQLRNSGHSWHLELPPELSRHTQLSSPALSRSADYQLAELHAHWPSEHRVRGRAASAELHFVHWDAARFGSLREAVSSGAAHALAVVGVLVEEQEHGDEEEEQQQQQCHRELDKIVEVLEDVRHRVGSRTQLRRPIDLKKLSPSNKWHYATYEGSLTTPPLTECVQWLLLLEPIKCHSSQLAEFRQLAAANEQPGDSLARNCRPPQQLNGRQVTIWHRADSSQDSD